MNDVLPDALASVLGKVVSDARREWIKAADLIAAEARATIAELRAENLQLRGQLQVTVDSELSRLREAAAAVTNGRDGVDGQPGEKGEQGPPGPAPDYGIVVERSMPMLRSLIEARWDEWTATLPLPERGEKGEPGERGPAADPDAVAEIVLRRLPPPERGEKGDPGQDADPEVIARLVAEKCGEALPELFDLVPRAVADEVQRAVAALPPPERGEPGQDGASIDPETVRTMIAEEVALLPPAERGEPGQPGQDADPELIQRMVEETVARSIPDPLPGRQGERGPPGQDIDPAEVVERVLGLLPAPERGPQGEPGQPGRSITEVKRIGDELLVVMNDGTTFSAGVVRGDTGPAGPMGETGPAGEPGRNGQEVDLDMLEALVAEKVAALPPPEKGDPGRDADPELLRQMVVDEVAKLPPPERGEPGVPGLDGKDADPAVIATLVAQEVGTAVAEIPVPRDGIDGKDADPAFVESLVVEKLTAAVNNLPPPERGEPGPRGEIGPPGKDGAGIAGALIDRSGSLILTLSDGSVRDLGAIVGRDGAPGAPGRDGADGLSFADFELEPEYDGERTFRLKWTNGNKTHAREWRLPIVLDRGIYHPSREYERGDSVTYAGSTWIAQTNVTGISPSGQTKEWRVAIRKGRDGKDGKDGEKGERGAEGRPGRDWTAQGFKP